MKFQKPEWVRYGLSTPSEDWLHLPHDLVAGYLDRHPEDLASHLNDWGEVKYFEVLALAELEAGLKVGDSTRGWTG